VLATGGPHRRGPLAYQPMIAILHPATDHERRAKMPLKSYRRGPLAAERQTFPP
jgi:hypothetical protein